VGSILFSIVLSQGQRFPRAVATSRNKGDCNPNVSRPFATCVLRKRDIRQQVRDRVVIDVAERPYQRQPAQIGLYVRLLVNDESGSSAFTTKLIGREERSTRNYEADSALSMIPPSSTLWYYPFSLVHR